MTIHAQVTLLTAGADSADNQTNGFAAVAVNAGTADYDAWTVAIKAFYEGIKFLGGCLGLATAGHIVKFYDITQPRPNYPIYETTFAFANANGPVQMPMECALCISYANTTLNAIPRARRRGRIYLSGWSEGFNDAGRPVEGNLSTVAGHYKTYAESVNAIASLTAGVWSRSNSVVYPIDTIWVDNEWDTQRSRGGKATERQTVTV